MTTLIHVTKGNPRIADLFRIVGDERRPCSRRACAHCLSTPVAKLRPGERRELALEVLLRNNAVAAGIKTGRIDSLENAILAGRKEGMIALTIRSISLRQGHYRGSCHAVRKDASLAEVIASMKARPGIRRW